MDCIFCKIASGDIPADRVYENESVLAFNDIEPISPVHVLIIPKTHIESINDLDKSNSSIMADIFLAVNEVARIMNIADTGYRVIINNGRAGGQEVPHLHVHVIGGRESLGPMLMK